MNAWNQALVRYRNSIEYSELLRETIKEQTGFERIHDKRIRQIAKTCDSSHSTSSTERLAKRYCEIIDGIPIWFQGRPQLTYWQRCARISHKVLEALGHSISRITGSTYFRCEKCQTQFRLYENDILGGADFWIWVDDLPKWQVPDFEDARETRALPNWMVRDAERDLYACGEDEG